VVSIDWYFALDDQVADTHRTWLMIVVSETIMQERSLLVQWLGFFARQGTGIPVLPSIAISCGHTYRPL
jgi:hypothetical protein